MRLRLLILTLVIMLILPCLCVVAQEARKTDILDIYDRHTLYIYQSAFSNGFIKDGQIINIGIFGSNLAKEMAGSRYAQIEMQKARKYKIIGSATMVVATAFQITSLVLIFRDDDNSKALDITSLLVGGFCGVLANGFNKSATASMNRAVWIYNRDVISGNIMLPERGIE